MKIVDEDTLELVDVPDGDEAKNSEALEKLKTKVFDAQRCEELNTLYKNYKKAEAEFNEFYEPFKKELLDLYKDNPELAVTAKNILLTDVKLTYVEPSTRKSIDTKRLKEEHPDIAKECTKKTDISATLRLSEIETYDLKL